jgi:hypothetical protein
MNADLGGRIVIPLSGAAAPRARSVGGEQGFRRRTFSAFFTSPARQRGLGLDRGAVELSPRVRLQAILVPAFVLSSSLAQRRGGSPVVTGARRVRVRPLLRRRSSYQRFPKIGGIVVPPRAVAAAPPPARLFTTAHPGAAAWDAARSFRVVRAPDGSSSDPSLARRIDGYYDVAGVVFLDRGSPPGASGAVTSRSVRDHRARGGGHSAGKTARRATWVAGSRSAPPTSLPPALPSQ